MRTLLPALALLLSISAGAQQTLIDSLRKAYALETDPLKKLDIYFNIADETKEIDVEQTFAYADTLERMAKDQNDLKGQGRAAFLRGRALDEKSAYSEAIPHLHKAVSVFRSIQDEEDLAGTYNTLGGLYSDYEQIDSGITYLLKAAELFQKLNQKSRLASVYVNIGNLYGDKKLYDKGIELLLKGLAMHQEAGNEKKTMYTYNNLAVIYGTKGDLAKAMEMSEKGIRIALKYDNMYVAGVISGGMGHILIEAKKYEEAIRMCEQSLDYLKKANRRVNMVFPLVNLAKAYNFLGQPQKALTYAKQGYAIMLETEQSVPMEEYLEQIALSYEKMGNYKESLIWFKKFLVLDDSLFRTENIKNVAEVETRYQTQKKEAEIANQKLQISEQQAVLFRQRTWIFALAGGIGLVFLLGFLFLNRYRLKQKALLDAAVIREQQLGLNAVIEAQEAERRRIAKDLHDGIAQELVALKLNLGGLQRKITAVAPAESERLALLNEQLDATCTEVRSLSHVMLPPVLEQQGLAPSLDLLLRNTFQLSGIQTEFYHHELPEQLDEKVKLGLYRIAQELLNNVQKHAHAQKVIVQLYKTANNLILQVQDDGLGFDFDAARNKGSMGLLNILSRVSTMRGVYASEFAQPRGTISTVRIPL